MHIYKKKTLFGNTDNAEAVNDSGYITEQPGWAAGFVVGSVIGVAHPAILSGHLLRRLLLLFVRQKTRL